MKTLIMFVFESYMDLCLLACTLSQGEKVICEVQDFGTGIKTENVEKIFHQFFRNNGPEEKSFPGIGLGLYISSQIIKKGGRQN